MVEIDKYINNVEDEIEFCLLVIETYGIYMEYILITLGYSNVILNSFKTSAKMPHETIQDEQFVSILNGKMHTMLLVFNWQWTKSQYCVLQ